MIKNDVVFVLFLNVAHVVDDRSQWHCDRIMIYDLLQLRI